MEKIRQAVELARAGGLTDTGGPAGTETRDRKGANRPRQQSGWGDDRADATPSRLEEVELDRSHLEARRIIAHDVGDPRAKSFDMLRTQILRSMDMQNWQFLAVTSPTPGCGKTVTAINLAFSIARQPERSVLLVDMDLQKPQVAGCLGTKCDKGLLGAVAGRTALADAMFQARIGHHRLMVLPVEAATSNSSEWIASRAMSDLLKQIKREFPSRIVILDMPPMLSSDEVITILPQIDCVLLVAAVGITTVSEIAECNRHLQAADVVRLVLNKAPGAGTNYYY